LRRLLAVLALICIPVQALAVVGFIQPGVPAPNFTKNQLVNGAVGSPWTLWSQQPRVVILFVLGYS
jgi:hypothetical protein